jgi:hypothetical protein
MKAMKVVMIAMRKEGELLSEELQQKKVYSNPQSPNLYTPPKENPIQSLKISKLK